MSMDVDEGYVLRVRGLPWSATKEEILNFFVDCKITNGVNGIHMTFSREGRPSGEAYIEMDTDDDLKTGVEKNNEHIGHRYIEVFKSKKSEMEWVIKRSSAHQEDALSDGCVRLRGLPFGCSKEEIAQFFSGLEIVPNGITLPTDFQGRTTGEAYVQFASRDIAEKALGKHKEKIGHRYIEIFRSTLQEVRTAVGFGSPKVRPMMGQSMRPSPYDRNERFGGSQGRYGIGRGGRNFRGLMEDDGYNDYPSNFGNGYNGNNGFGFQGMGNRGGRFNYSNDYMRQRGGPEAVTFNYNHNRSSGHCVHMRGLPFRASEDDIVEFFRPMSPINIQLNFDDTGRPSGEADVMFNTHDEAVKAMTKDKANMQHRYIELFLNSTPSGSSSGGGGGGGGGGNASGNFNPNFNSWGSSSSSMGYSGSQSGGMGGNSYGRMSGQSGGGYGSGSPVMGGNGYSNQGMMGNIKKDCF